jgi:hypothetical protein
MPKFVMTLYSQRLSTSSSLQCVMSSSILIEKTKCNVLTLASSKRTGRWARIAVRQTGSAMTHLQRERRQ